MMTPPYSLPMGDRIRFGYTEPDFDQPEQRRHCARCGAFLTKKETGCTPVHTLAVDPGSEDTDFHSFPRLATEEEIAAPDVYTWTEGGEPYWDCSVCGHTHDLDEMWTEL